ncbi:MAG: hypothetical protein WCK77_24430 [Verrucomicrobiota bacterium]
MSKALLVIFVLASPFGLGACGGAGQGTAASKLSARFSVANLFPASVPIVKVREKDLKELPLGHERALAFEKQRKSGLWAFAGTADFVQPKLPEAGSEMDGSLLPPKDP